MSTELNNEKEHISYTYLISGQYVDKANPKNFTASIQI
jgi:hypothetical protein